MTWSQVSGWIAAAILVTPFVAPAAEAQQPAEQTITWTMANQTGMTGWAGPTYLCVANNRTLYNSNQALEMAWNDTTGAIVGAVRVEMAINWQYLYNPLPTFTVSINGVQQAGTLAPNGTQSNCSANTLQEVSYETGITSWNPGGGNTLTITPTGTTYACLNSTAAFFIQLVVTQLNLPPDSPTNLAQLGPDSTTIPVGGTCPGTTVRLRATVSDPDLQDCLLEAEFQDTSTFFLNLPNYAGPAAPAGQNAAIDITSLAEGPYHWQVRAVDPFDFVSGWVAFGGNSEILADVVVSNQANVPPPLDGVDHGGGDCTISVGAGVGAGMPALFGLALLSFGLGRRRR